MSGQRRCLAGHTLHHAAVAAQRVHVVIEHHEVGAVEVAAHPSLGDGHADAGGNALPERPRGRLDAGRPPVLRMARALAVELSEPLDVVEGDLLARVPHTLALVGLGGADIPDLGGDLTDFLPIDALDDDFRLTRGLHGNAFRNREGHRVREAQSQVQGLALHLGAESNAYELELALVALGDTEDHVREVSASGTRLRARQAGIRVLDLELLVRLDD